MMDSSFILVVYFLVCLLNTDLSDAYVNPVQNISDYKFIAFIGAKIRHNAEGAQGEIVREVVGIGAVIGNKYILTTEEYMKWHGQPNLEYFVLLGTHDFDNGGVEVSFLEEKEVPQTGKDGSHTIVLLKFARDLTTINGVEKMKLEPKFTQSGISMEMVGIYQRDAVRLGVTTELARANAECNQLLDVNSNDKRYSNVGSHMCIVSTNLLRVDCKSHIGSIVFYRLFGVGHLTGIKSQIHQSCSTVPYIIQYQRTSHVADWITKNMI